jgi:hypothetical protein
MADASIFFRAAATAAIRAGCYREAEATGLSGPAAPI